MMIVGAVGRAVPVRRGWRQVRREEVRTTGTNNSFYSLDEKARATLQLWGGSDRDGGGVRRREDPWLQKPG